MSLDTNRLMDFWPALVGVFRNRLPRHSHTVWEDLAGDTIERAIRNADRYTERGNGPYSWLSVMAAHIASDYLRRHINRPENVLPLEDYGQATVDAGGDRHVAVIDVQHAVGRLHPAEREYVRLRFEEDRYLDEIGPRTTAFRHGVAVATRLRGLRGGVA